MGNNKSQRAKLNALRTDQHIHREAGFDIWADGETCRIVGERGVWMMIGFRRNTDTGHEYVDVTRPPGHPHRGVRSFDPTKVKSA